MRKIVVASVLLFGCSSKPAAPVEEPAADVTVPPASSAESGVTAAPAETAAPTAVAADVKPVPPIDPAASCFLCRSEGKRCVRPDVSSQMAALTCGDGNKLASTKIEGKPIDCDAACCRPAGAKGKDTDADGLADDKDKCPDAPEDVDGFQDNDGCPDLDNDQDGVEDVHDKCCFLAEDLDQNQDLDGCPE